MLKYLTAGESHGPQLTAIVDGLPAGMPISLDKLNFQLSRRQKGYGRGGRMKIEKDAVQILSGLRHGKTLGSPVTIVIANRDWENWQTIMDPFQPLPEKLHLKEERLARETSKPRPGHADLAGGIKYNHHDLRNVLERASARETAARMAVGALCRQLLEQFGVQFASHVVRIGKVSLPAKARDLTDLDSVIAATENSEVRCIDDATAKKMIAEIKAAKKERDSLGGVVEVIVRGLPVGLGGISQGTDRLDGVIAGAMMSIPSVKGVEIGLGFESARLRGSRVHDEIFFSAGSDPKKKHFTRKTNRAGGFEGGITTGEDVIIRVANKPISTLNRPLKTVDVRTKKPAEAMVERTDNCVVPAVGVICESMTAIVFANAFLEKFSSDNFEETTRNFQSFLNTDY